MSAVGERSEGDRTGVRVAVLGSGDVNVVTGLPVLDHLLAVLAEHAGFDLALEVAPGEPLNEVAAAGRALGTALAGPLRVADARRHGSAALPADEALAHVALEASDRPLVVSNVDLSGAHIGGLGGDLLGRFLDELADGAGLTLHVRLIEGEDPQHVLEAIFKALGVALAQACRPRR
jgi:imidazoleglycerol-phosphate dehydratase